MIKVMEKKRARTRAAILKSSKGLFVNNGFDETSMEEIAADAEIATGTLYNYFKTKSALLFAMYEDLAVELIQNAPKRQAGLIDAQTALRDVFAVLVHFSKTGALFPKPIMRKVMSHLFAGSAQELGDLVSIEIQFMSLLLPVVQDMEEAGLLAPGVDIQGAAMLLYSTAAANLQAYITVNQMSEEQMVAVLKMQVNSLFFGILPRK